MLSMNLMSGGQGAYYTTLAREDYYLSGGEPPGRWVGDAAKKLKLDGAVSKEHLASLFSGFSPTTGKALVQNAGADKHRPGWDLTFSAPKSVSVLWSQADKAMANEIRAAQQDSVEKALKYLEDVAGFTRRGKGGVIVEPAKLLVATFEHGTSRAQDPQLHTHALVLNVGLRADGTTGSIESKALYQHKMAAGALYRAELSSQLQKRLGIETERVGTAFEVNGIPHQLIKEFSKRRNEIESILEQRGFTSAKASEMAAVTSRDAKEHQPREKLLTQWQEVGKAFGFSTEQATQLQGRVQPIMEDNELSSRKGRVTADAIAQITNNQAHFPERDIVRIAAQEAQGRGLSAKDVLDAVGAKLKAPEMVHLQDARQEERFTTAEMLALEAKLISKAQILSGDTRHQCNNAERVIEKRFSFLNDEQKSAVSHLTEKTGAIGIVSGMAGTGKTTMLKACAEVWKENGFDVLGTSLSGKATDGLRTGAGIPSVTIAKLMIELEKPAERSEVGINSKTVVIVDEAAMVGTRQLEKLISAVKNNGSKLVMIGDAKQLQPIEAGGAFPNLANRLGEAQLTDIKRQNDPWMRDVVKDMAAGNSTEALTALAEAGQLHVCKDKVDAFTQLLTSWNRGGGVQDPASNLILASTNEDTRILNREAQQMRRDAGEVSKEGVNVDGNTISKGDRIVFTKGDRVLGVKNGNLATVTKVHGNQVTAIVDDRVCSFSVNDFPYVSLGYAVTTHKSQGATTKNAYLLTNDMMQDREISYVQVSRAKEKTQLFTTEAEAGFELTELSRTMHRSRMKTMASDLSSISSSPSISLSSDSSHSPSQGVGT